MEDKKGFDAHHLIFSIVRRWKVILITGIILSLSVSLVNILVVIINDNFFSDSEKPDMVEKEEEINIDIEDSKAYLYEAEIKEVDITYDTYLELQQQYNQMEDYLKNSIYMNLDSNAVYSGLLYVSVDADYTVEYPIINKRDYTIDIVASYTTRVNADPIMDKMYELYSGKYKKEYFPELVSTGSKTTDIFWVQVYGTDENMCHAYINAIKEYFNEIHSDIKAKYGDYEYDIVNEIYTCKADTTILADQKTNITNANSIKSSWISLSNNLNANQKKYYNLLLKKAQLAVAQHYQTKVDDQSFFQKYLNIKMILITGILGCIMAIIVIGWKYLSSNTIKTRYVFEEYYRVPLVSYINISRKKNVIDRFISNCFYKKERSVSEKESLKYLETLLNLMSKEDNLGKIYITGTCESDINRIKKIAGLLGENEVGYGNSITSNGKSLMDISSYDSVIFVEHLSRTRVDDMEREIFLAKQCNINIVGVIALDEL